MNLKVIALALAATTTMLATGTADAQKRQRRVVVTEECRPNNTLAELIWPTCSVKRSGTNASPHVRSGGTYVGQDPDPRVRAQLRREFDTGADGLN